MAINEILAIILRIGFCMIILAFFLPRVKKKPKSKIKSLRRRMEYFEAKETKSNMVIWYLKNLTDRKEFDIFRLKPDSKKYLKLENMISSAGGFYGLTPNMIEIFTNLAPLITGAVLAMILFVKAKYFTVLLTAEQLEAQINANLGSGIEAQVSATGKAAILNPKSAIFILIAMGVVMFLPEFLLKFKIRQREKAMDSEIDLIEMFSILMIKDATHPVYDILKTLYDTTDFFKPYIARCLSQYNKDPLKAIQNMADEVGNEHFSIICNGLKQAVFYDKKYTAQFLDQHAEQLKVLGDLKHQKQISKKPLLLTLIVAIPMGAVVVLLIYPWFSQAMSSLSFSF